MHDLFLDQFLLGLLLLVMKCIKFMPCILLTKCNSCSGISFLCAPGFTSCRVSNEHIGGIFISFYSTFLTAISYSIMIDQEGFLSYSPTCLLDDFSNLTTCPPDKLTWLPCVFLRFYLNDCRQSNYAKKIISKAIIFKHTVFQSH